MVVLKNTEETHSLFGHPLLQLNAHMEDSVGGTNAGLFAMPRAPGGFGCAGRDTPVSGISSFAFQGTNAHVLVRPAAVEEASEAATVKPTWLKQYISVVPIAHVQVTAGCPVLSIPSCSRAFGPSPQLS
jgi:hypothetical protein